MATPFIRYADPRTFTKREMTMKLRSIRSNMIVYKKKYDSVRENLETVAGIPELKDSEKKLSDQVMKMEI